VLRQLLAAKGLPAPNQRGTDTAYRFPFTANAAIHLRDDGRTASRTGQTAPEQARMKRQSRHAFPSFLTFIGHPAYGLDALHADLDRFAFLLGGNHGEFLLGQNPALPARNWIAMCEL
jgi:hypothetical protein